MESLDWSTVEVDDEQLLEAEDDPSQKQQQQGGAGGHLNLSLCHLHHRENTRFGVRRDTFRLRWEAPDDLAPKEFARQLVGTLHETVREHAMDMHPQDFLQIYMGSNRLHHNHTSHCVRVQDWRDNSEPAGRLLDQLAAILNSNEEFKPDDSFTMDIFHIRIPQGTGRRKLGTQQFSTLMKAKKVVITIKNKDDLCCARALVTARARHHKDESVDALRKYDSLRKGYPLQEHCARELHKAARVPVGPCGLNEIKMFQIMLDDYQIIIVSADQANSIIFEGAERDRQLILLLHEGHYDVITSLPGYFGKHYFCLKCKTGFDHNDFQHHRCQGQKCYCCHQTDCPDFAQHGRQPATLHCRECNRHFFGLQCLDRHTSRNDKGETVGDNNCVCASHRKCGDCRRTLMGHEHVRDHICGHGKCPSCGAVIDLHLHECFLQPINLKKTRGTKRSAAATAHAFLDANEPEDPPVPPEHDFEPGFVFFDIEACQDEGQHMANLLCAETSFNNQQHTFLGETCVDDFLGWLTDLVGKDPAKSRHWIVVAHNLQGYDGYMIVEALYHQVIQPRQIVKGAKLLGFTLPGDRIKFKDSMSFFPMPLSAFPKTFGLTKLTKGFFPHFFNTRLNQRYVGSMPPKETYDPQGMTTARRREFDDWYQQQVDNCHVFDFQAELLAYCQSDVRLLKEGCLKFNKDFQKVCNFNPMELCLTIASACNMAYRAKWMPKEKIAVEPLHGWGAQRGNQSRAALEWLHWVEQKLTASASATAPALHHAANGTERVFRVGHHQYRVDGYDPSTRTIYEFHGCFWHGCTTCFQNRNQRHAKLDHANAHEVRERTLLRTEALINAGYKVIEMWECQWMALKKDKPDIRAFANQLELVAPLDPRDAFFGGRTEAIYMVCKVTGDEQIHYDDFTSLYPWTNKYCRYPLGHPLITTAPNTPTDQSRLDLLQNTFGLLKCKVLPPFGLHLPVLPHRQGGKLTFPLCRTCVETEMAKLVQDRSFLCPHSQEERALTGTWCTPELEEAVAQGYKILYIYERWHFPQSSNDLFKPYVDTFLKIKQEASGWPTEVGDDPQKREDYVKQYLFHEGVALMPANIQKNPGLRALAKLMLNSFWGKFGQQPNKTQVTTCKDPQTFFEIFLDDSQDIHKIDFAGPEMLDVYHSHKEDVVPVQTNTNIFVAAFTTCWARLKLYQEALHPLQGRALYMDTDSVIYLCSESQPHLPRGNYLGQFTNELDEGDYITEFVTGGPKNYGYRTRNGKTSHKVRGFSHNVRTDNVLNFESIRTLVVDELTSPQDDPRTLRTHNPHKIVRDSATKTIHSKPQTKVYRSVFDKRVVNWTDGSTRPYGYAAWDPQGDQSDRT